MSLLFLMYRSATATVGLNVFIKIFFAIVIGELFTNLDILDGVDKHLPFHDVWLAVWLTRMIDIAGEVVALSTVDSLTAIYFKKVFTITYILFFFRNFATKIFNDSLPFFVRTSSEEPEPRARPLYL